MATFWLKNEHFFSTLKILRLFYSFRIFSKNIGKKLIVKILRNFYNLFYTLVIFEDLFLWSFKKISIAGNYV